MRIVIVVNARSGRGRAVRIADAIGDELRRRGHEAVITSLDACGEIAGADAVVVAGGDGTLHALLETCARAEAPVYHAPAGTENLFAREFAMSSHPEAVADAIERGRRVKVDVGRANGRAFVIMASIGFDAAVIHRLDAIRGASISHVSYVKPTLQVLGRFPLARLTIEVDGAPVVEDRTGLVIVANSRQYAMRMDPARAARMDDGLLDVVFMSFRTRLGLLQWTLLAMAGAHSGDARLVTARGRSIEITGDEAHLQLDGEAAGRGAAWRFGIEAGSLGVIEPRA